MYKTTKTAATLLTATVLGAGSALAATSWSKGGMNTTSSPSSTATASNSTPSTGGWIYNSEMPMIAKGVQELSLSGHYNWENTSNYALNIGYGRFITDNIELGVEAGVNGVNSNKTINASIFAEYDWLNGTKWVPFVRATVGYARVEGPVVGEEYSEDSCALGGQLGLKYFLRSNLSIFARAGGQWLSSGESDFNKQVDLGLNFYF